MSALYLPLGIVVTVTMMLECSPFCLIEDAVGHTYKVPQKDVRILSTPAYEGIC